MVVEALVVGSLVFPVNSIDFLFLFHSFVPFEVKRRPCAFRDIELLEV